MNHKNQLKELRRAAQKLGSGPVTQETRKKVMAIYRKDPGLITKEDLLLFGIIIKKEKTEQEKPTP